MDSITILPKNQTLTTGNTIQLIYNINPVNATNKNVIWTSTDEAVATVDLNGKVTAVSKGFAAIMAMTEDGNKYDFCNITVEQGAVPTILVTGITVTPSSEIISVGTDFQLSAVVYPTNATDKTVNWSSTNQSIATVDSTGLVTGISVGTAMIISTTNDGGFGGFSNITVEGSITPDLADNLALNATAIASSTVSTANAIDGNMDTRWMAATDSAGTTYELDLGMSKTFNQIKLFEFGTRIGNFTLEYWNGTAWVNIHSGSSIGAEYIANFNDITSSKIKLTIVAMKNSNGASLKEFEVYKK